MKKFLSSVSCLFILLGGGLISCNQQNNNVDDNDNKNDDDKGDKKEDPVDYVSSTYSNPVQVISSSGGNYSSEIADPSVVRDPESGIFYSFSTSRKVLSSEDGCIWTLYAEGYNVINWPSWGKEVQPNASLGMWAPDVVKINNLWYYFYSLSGWGSPAGIGYGISENIGGPYVDKGKLFSCEEIGINNCIDSATFVDDDGKIYITAGSFQGLYIMELELNDDGTLECLNGVDYQKENKVLIAGKEGTAWDGSQYEGGYIIKKDGYYYYFGSSGTCCENQSSTYQVRVGKSESITGPYVGSDGMPLTFSGNGKTYGNLVVWAGTSNTKDVAGPGHNSIFKDDAGDYWIYYHAYSSLDTFSTRHLFMDKLLWDENGFPYVEGKKPSFQEEIDGPRLI